MGYSPVLFSVPATAASRQVWDGWEDDRHRGRRNKQRTKVKKADHKHDYQPIIVLGTVRDDNRLHFNIATYCPICGRCGDGGFNIVSNETIEKLREICSVGNGFWNYSGVVENNETILQKMKTILPIYRMKSEEYHENTWYFSVMFNSNIKYFDLSRVEMA